MPHQGTVSFEAVRVPSGLVVRGSDGSFCHSNVDHVLKVKRARNRLNLVLTQAKPDVPHALTGKEIVDKASGQQYTVARVYEDWWHGRFLTALLERGGSHRTVVVANISCLDPAIAAQAEAFKRSFEVVQ